MSVKIIITQEMRDWARSADTTMQKHWKQGKNYTGLERKDRLYLGLLGERSVCQLLRQHKKLFDYTPVFDGKPDTGDIGVSMCYPNNPFDQRRLELDVKTATEPGHSRIMIPRAQVERHGKAYLYVGVRLNSEDEAEVFGYCTLEDMLLEDEGFDHNKVPTYWQRLDKLTPISELLRWTV